MWVFDVRSLFKKLVFEKSLKSPPCTPVFAFLSHFSSCFQTPTWINRTIPRSESIGENLGITLTPSVPIGWRVGMGSAKKSPLVDGLGWVQPRCPIGWRAVIASLAMFPEFVTFLLSVPIGWRAVRASLALFPLVVTMLQVSYWLTGFDKQPSPVPIGCFYFAKCYDWLTGWDDPNRIVTAEPWVPDPGSVFHLQKSEQFR